MTSPALGFTDPVPETRPRAWWLYLLAGSVVVGGYWLLPAGLVRDLTYVGVGVSAVAAMLAGVRRHRPVRPQAWYALTAGQAVWVLGDVAGLVVSRGPDAEAFPSAADVFYLLAYPLLGLGLYLLTRGRRPRQDVEGLVDSLTVLIGLVLVSWVLLAEPAIAQNYDEPLAAVVAGAYPQLDVVIFVMLVALITTPGARTAALRLLVVSLGLVVVADTGATTLNLLTFDSTGPLDLLWMAAYLLIGAAVLHPSVRELSVPTPAESGRFGRSRLVATILTTLVPPATLILEHLSGRAISVWPIALASAAMFLLVVGRMNIVITQIGAANTERERAQVALAYEASHDSLTGLPNRAQGLQLISGSLARAQRSGAMVGLLFVDLDGFKAVNDTYGHRAGDEVLGAVARRMQEVVREGDMVGRLGGDEFVVLLEPVVETESAVGVAQRLIAAVSAPIVLGSGQRVLVGASVGVATSQDAGTDAEALLNEADTAAYRAKRLGRGRVEVFGENLRRELRERSAVESALRTAIAEGGLDLRFEPVVELATGLVLGYKALPEWHRPGVGCVPAADFRPVAELSDLIIELDTWVLREATRRLAGWNERSPDRLRLGVEVSARHLARSRVLDDVGGVLEESGIAVDQLVVEITDTTLVGDPIAFGHLDRLRERGLHVGLADFGSGYSSVRRLKRLPIDSVRLHESYLRQSSDSGRVMLRLMVEGVRNYGLSLVVHGVTTAADVQLLIGLGCDRGSGSFYGGPFTADEVAARLPVGQSAAS